MSGAGLTLFLVDDDDLVARSIARPFKRRDCTVRMIHDAAEADCELRRDLDANGVLLDIHLGIGKPTGVDLLERARHRGCDVPVLVLTSLDDAEAYPYTRRVQAARAQFCPKPLSDANVDAFIATMRASAPPADDDVIEAGICAYERSLGQAFTPAERGLITAQWRGIKQCDYARTIGRSIDTVETHAKSVLRKTREDGMAAVVAIVRRLGLEDAPRSGRPRHT